MKIPVRSAATAALILFLSAPLALAQRGGGMRAGDSLKKEKVAAWRGDAQLSGKITDEAGKGIPEAKVTFIFGKSNDGFFTTTKKNGEFSAKDIKGGEWRVQIEASNFITVRQPLTVSDSKNPPLDVHLKRDNGPELVAAAEGLFKAGKFGDARAEYLKVLEAHPEFTGINRAIAFTYGREGNHADALKYLDLAIANNPNDNMLLQLAAASAMEVNSYPRAMAYLGKIDESTLAEPDALVNASVNLISKQHPIEAIAVLDRVIAKFPQAPEAYFYRGFARLQVDRVPDGKADLEHFLSLAPPDAPQGPQAKELLSKLK